MCWPMVQMASNSNDDDRYNLSITPPENMFFLYGLLIELIVKHINEFT